MTTHLASAAEFAAPLAPKSSRRATARDKLRVAEYARLLDEGEDDLDAAWQVLAHPDFGISRWRGARASERPSDMALVRKLSAMLARTVPELVDRARDTALARIAGLAGKAVKAVDEVTSGEFVDSKRARVRLEGARTVLDSLGTARRNADEGSAQRDAEEAVVKAVHSILAKLDSARDAPAYPASWSVSHEGSEDVYD